MHTISDRVHTGIIFTLDGAAILSNIILIYAIITRTPHSMRAYSILLLNNTFVDISSAIASMAGVARLIYLREYAVQLYVFVGCCSHIGNWCCILCQAVHSYLVCHSALILLHSFCFRLYLIREKKVDIAPPSSKATLLIGLMLYCPSLLMMTLYYISVEDAPQYLVSSLHFEDYATAWNPNLLDIRFLIPVAYLCTLAPSAMVVIFFARRRLIKEIMKMESSKRDHHSSVAKALTYQLLLPAGQAVAGATWLLGVAGIWEDEIAERTIMIVSSLLALGSPLINIAFLPPYRRLFGKSTTIRTAYSAFDLPAHSFETAAQHSQALYWARHTDCRPVLILTLQTRGTFEVPRWRNLIGAVVMSASMLFTYTIIVFCSYRISKYIEERSKSAQSIHLHKQLFRSLMYQSFVPLFTAYYPAGSAVLLPVFGLPFIPIAIAGPPACATHPLFDPLLLIFTINDYRRAFLNLTGLSKLTRAFIRKSPKEQTLGDFTRSTAPMATLTF